MDASIASAAGSTTDTTKVSSIRNILNYLPMMTVALVFFVILKQYNVDVRSTILSVMGFELSWVEVILFFAMIVTFTELLKVSHPGADETWEAIILLFNGVFYLLLFALGISNEWQMFANTEFFQLTTLCMLQGIVGLMLNARTLKRSFISGGGEG